LGRSRAPVSPASRPSVAASISASRAARLRTAGSPARLALVETSGPPKAVHRAATTGWALTRNATPSCSPLIQRGTRGVTGTIQVFGPGQLARTSALRPGGSGSQSAMPSNCAGVAATRIRPLSTPRCLSASRRSTAASSKGSQDRPQTLSVGQATRPPRRSTATASAMGRTGALTLSPSGVGLLDHAAPADEGLWRQQRRRLRRRCRRGGLLRHRLLRGLLRRRLLRRGLLRCSLLGGLFCRGFFRCSLLRRRLLRGGLLAEAAAHRLAGLLQQPGHFLQRQRCRFAILGNASIELAVADVGSVAPVEHLDVAALEFLDDAVARDLFLLLDQEHRARKVDGVRIVFLLQRGIDAAAPGERAEAADADADFLAVGLAELARKPEQLQCVLERDGVHALARPQRGEGRL